MDQIFALKMMVEEYLGKTEKLYAVFMDLKKKAFDRVDGEALWNILKIFGVVELLLSGIKAFYRETSACVRMDRDLS